MSLISRRSRALWLLLAAGCSGGVTQSDFWGDPAQSEGGQGATSVDNGAGETSRAGAASDAPITVELPGGEQALAHRLVVKRAGDVSSLDFEAALETVGATRLPRTDLLFTELGYETVELPPGVELLEGAERLQATGLAESAEPVIVVPLEA